MKIIEGRGGNFLYIEHINSPSDLKKFNAEERKALAQEMRDILLKRASIHGGHFGPDFGIVETTIALHTVFDSPRDKIVYDVSHQSYPHKILTGRKKAYLEEAHYGDVSGYTNPDESEHDFFNVGHTSTAISLASGLAKARDLAGRKENIIALIGDGSMSGGEALEGLDFVGEMDTNFIIVFNDNDMSIAENHGGMYKKFKELRDTNGKAEDNLFRAMGLDYIYVAEGNDTEALIAAFESVKDSTKPVVVHVFTQKGKGYKFAEENREAWHYHAPFDVETGETKNPYTDKYAQMTTEFILAEAKANPDFAAIAAGTMLGLGISPENRQKLGKQYIDVGIAEEHAVAMASGMAKGGARPLFSTYSTFFQRVYDQMSQDVAVNNNPAVFLSVGASLYFMNDVTHLGFYDIPLFANIPNLVFLAPTSPEEYLAMLRWSIDQRRHPVMIRMPVGGLDKARHNVRKNYSELNTFDIIRRGAKVAFIGLGSFYALAEQAAEIMKEKGIEATLINPIFASGIDKKALSELELDHSLVVTLEDGILDGGYGEKIARYYGTSTMKVMNFGLPKKFYDRYKPKELAKENHLTPEQIAADVLAKLN